jgi:hypothetical protein
LSAPKRGLSGYSESHHHHRQIKTKFWKMFCRKQIYKKNLLEINVTFRPNARRLKHRTFMVLAKDIKFQFAPKNRK